MVHRLVVSYGQPTDPAAFDAYYRDTHAPLALQQPGLVRLTYGHAQSLDPSQPGPLPRRRTRLRLRGGDGASMASPEGRAAGKDIRNFATGGATFVHFDVQQAV